VGQQVLVVDDDPTVGEVLLGYLRRAGFEPLLATDGEAALEIAARAEPDLVVLDVMLPGLDGLSVYRELIRTRPVPVIMLTALSSEHDRVLGLELGADDYVTKPFSPRELVLRIQSVLRRIRPDPARSMTGVLTGADIRVDLAGHRVSRAGEELALTAREFDLLVFFLTHPGRAFSRAELMEQVWGWSFGDLSTVTVHVRRLREKIEADPASPELLVTVWGVGYRYDPPRADGGTA
jgi:two-component system, OmpR family, response regulator ResD